MKRAVNLSIDEDLIVEAKAFGINLSAVMEEALKRDLSERRYQAWREENREAIQRSNAELQRNGIWIKPMWLEE